jgi:hypothetical protein
LFSPYVAATERNGVLPVHDVLLGWMVKFFHFCGARGMKFVNRSTLVEKGGCAMLQEPRHDISEVQVLSKVSTTDNAKRITSTLAVSFWWGELVKVLTSGELLPFAAFEELFMIWLRPPFAEATDKTGKQ